MKKVVLIAINDSGASIAYEGKSKLDARQKFLNDYSPKGFKIKYYDEYGNKL